MCSFGLSCSFLGLNKFRLKHEFSDPIKSLVSITVYINLISKENKSIEVEQPITITLTSSRPFIDLGKLGWQLVNCLYRASVPHR